MTHLPHDAKPVGGVQLLDFGVQAKRGLELDERERLLHAQHLDTAAQYIERAALVHVLADALGQHCG